jgi:hypothetical protein
VGCYTRELFALGLSGEGGLTRAERQSMAAHWAERAAAEEAAEAGGGGGGRGLSLAHNRPRLSLISAVLKPFCWATTEITTLIAASKPNVSSEIHVNTV